MSNERVSTEQLQLALIEAWRRQAHTFLRIIDQTVSQYDRYRDILQQVLNDFLSEEDRIRLLNLKPELLQIISDIDARTTHFVDGASSATREEVGDFNNEMTNRLLNITLAIDRILNPSRNVIAYKKSWRITSEVFAKLNIREALSFFPKTSAGAVCVTAGFYAAKYWHIIPKALAATDPTGSGVSQQTLDAVVLIFAIAFVLVFVGCFVVGFIYPKNEVAVHITGHLTTFISGALLGILGHVQTG